MLLTAEEAIGKLNDIIVDSNNPSSAINELRSLVNQLNVFSEGNITLLFSGGSSTQVVNSLVSQNENIRSINRTEAAAFLDLGDNKALDAKLWEIFDTDPTENQGIKGPDNLIL